MTTTFTPSHNRAVTIGLAEWMGWTKKAPHHASRDYWYSPIGDPVTWVGSKMEFNTLPAYTTSLDALGPVLERLDSVHWMKLEGLLDPNNEALFSPQIFKLALTTPPDVLADAVARVLKVGPHKNNAP